ncbi:MAG: PepSY domain-containing protein [Oscillospiraceae bacterium]
MTDRDIENRFRSAVEKAAPDELSALLSSLPEQKSRPPEDTAAPEKLAGRKSHWRTFAAAAAAVLILVCGLYGAGWYRAYHAVTSVVGFDVNPSIELKLNSRETVVAATALNADAEQILGGMRLEGTDLEVAVNALIGSMLKNGYISELANSILITVENDDAAAAEELTQRLTQEINSLLSVSSTGGAVLSQSLSSDTELEQLAAQYGISQGKAALVQEILSISPTYTFEELASLSINEMALLLTNPTLESEKVTSTGTASDKAYIGTQAAKEAALRHASLTESQVRELEAEFDHDDGKMVYDVEFVFGGTEYEYKIDALTGDVLKAEVEGGSGGHGEDHKDHGAETVTASITAEQARSIALDYAGVAASEAKFEKIELDTDDGVTVYELEFTAGGMEYECTVNASTGAILEWEAEKN